jgi:hypothetical protein
MEGISVLNGELIVLNAHLLRSGTQYKNYVSAANIARFLPGVGEAGSENGANPCAQPKAMLGVGSGELRRGHPLSIWGLGGYIPGKSVKNRVKLVHFTSRKALRMGKFRFPLK